MCADVGLKCLVETEGPWTDGASEWAIGSCSVVSRHRSRSETMDDGRVKLMGVGKVKVETGASAESFRTQGALVETLDSVEEAVELKVAVMQGGKGTVGTMKLEQERRHTLVEVGEKTLLDDRARRAPFIRSRGLCR